MSAFAHAHPRQDAKPKNSVSDFYIAGQLKHANNARHHHANQQNAYGSGILDVVTFLAGIYIGLSVWVLLRRVPLF